MGKAANVVTNKAENRNATAHDLRRSFGTRWARKLPPAILRDLMRHSSIETTMTYYVGQAAEDVGDVLRAALGTNLGTNDVNEANQTEVEADAKNDTIRA
jgi:integrase